MLGGFALENALKAFLVSENPEWISNGRLSRKLRSHSLITLQQQIKRVPFKKSLLRVLLEFEEGLDSWARYPCGLDASRSGHQTVLTEKSWDGYLTLMAALWEVAPHPAEERLAWTKRLSCPLAHRC